MKPPLFTVIMPTRNRASLLPTALKSLLWQTCGDFEAVVMDDGSTDSTPEVFKAFSGDQRFSFHRLEPLGVPKSRNYALRRAKGRFVTFLDDDDIWLPNRLEEFRKAAESRPAAGFWFSNAYIWRFDRIVGRVFEPDRTIPEGRVPGWYAIGEGTLPYVTTNMSISREAMEKVGFFHEELPTLCDTEMVVRVLAEGYETGVLREALAVRRMHDAQVTRDHASAYRQTKVVLDSAKLPPAEAAALRRGYAHDTALYLIKGLEPEKARRFLADSGIPRDAAYWRLYAASLTPRPLLSGLRAARAALLKGAPHPPASSSEFAAVETLVRTIL